MIVGTAGHIDHGKSTLVRALTGTDPDRLPEEKARGITIDLGFAYRRPNAVDEPSLGFVDVPGHERLVHTMLAGAGGIDVVLLVVAADDGPMPQTREHLQILDLLGLRRGLVALSKCDLVPPERIAAVTAELRALLAGTGLAEAEIVPVSAVSGMGLEELETHLLLAAAELPPRATDGPFRLAVDRGFTVAGAGVVATGTVLRGTVRPGDRLLLSPEGREMRVRGLHAQNRAADLGQAGQRCAINLVAPQLRKEDVKRGDWLIATDLHAPTERIDVTLRLLPSEAKPLRHWTPVHLHLAAAHVPARVALLDTDSLAPGDTAAAQLVLDRPIGALWGDRVVLRDQSARRTIAGGPVLDPWPPMRGRRRPERLATLRALSEADPIAALQALAAVPPGAIDLPRFARARALTSDAAAALWPAAGLAVAGPFGFAGSRWRNLTAAAVATMQRHHQETPESPGLERDRLRLALPERLPSPVFAALAEAWLAGHVLETDGARLRLPGHAVTLTAADQRLWARVEPMMRANKFEPPRVRDFATALKAREEDVRALLRRMAKIGLLVQVAPDHFFPRPVVAEMVGIVATLAAQGEVTAAMFRDRIGTGRKLAILILEFFDRAGVTARRGDLRRVQTDKLSLFGQAA